LFTNWILVRLEVAKIVSGNGPVSAVDWNKMLRRVESERTEDVFAEEDVTDPAGMFPSPVIERVCNPTSDDNEKGRMAGTPGNTSVKDVTRPAVSHCMPLQEPQKSTSFIHPTFCKVWFAVAFTISLSAQNCKTVPWPVVSVFFVVGERSLGIV
jgi:hypothetical protein